MTAANMRKAYHMRFNRNRWQPHHFIGDLVVFDPKFSTSQSVRDATYWSTIIISHVMRK